MRKSRKLKYGTSPIELHKPELHNTLISIITAAKLLVISRQHLYRVIKRYRISISKTSWHITIKYKDPGDTSPFNDSNIISWKAQEIWTGLRRSEHLYDSQIAPDIDETSQDYKAHNLPLLPHTFAMQLLENGTNGERTPFDFTNTLYFQQYSFTKNSNILNLSFYEFFSILQLLAS